jgi:hypothetical protein
VIDDLGTHRTPTGVSHSGALTILTGLGITNPGYPVTLIGRNQPPQGLSVTAQRLRFPPAMPVVTL